jgi:transposase
MRGDDERQEELIMLTSLEDVVPSDHPLRVIRAMVDAALTEMSPTLEALYAGRGRHSIAPEVLLRAQLIQILYAIPSERRLVEHALGVTPHVARKKRYSAIDGRTTRHAG